MPAQPTQRVPASVHPIGRFVGGPWGSVLLAILCFANTIGNDFVRDDTYVISINPRIQSLSNWHGIWLSNWWQVTAAEDILQPAEPDRLYRPFTLFTFALNYAVCGLYAPGYFAANVALHAATAGLVWLLARRVTRDWRVAAVAGLLFAVHPIHSEAVANAVGRADVLGALFTLAGLLALLPESGVPTLRRGVVAAGLFLLALLSKESAVCYVGLAMLALAVQWPAVHGGRRVVWLTGHCALLAIPLAVYLPLRLAVLGSVTQTGVTDQLVNPLIGTAGMERVIGVLTIAGYYARAVLFPVWLSSDYGLAVVDPRSGPTLTTLLGAIAAAAILVALLGWLRRNQLWRQLALWATLFLLSYALISNAALLIGTSLGERLFYWPSAPLLIGLAVLIVAACRRLASTHRPAIALGGLALLLLGGRAIARNADWRSGAALAARDVANWPRSAQLHASRAWYVGHAVLANPPRPDAPPAAFEHAERELARAQWHAEESLRISPGNTNAEHILVEVLMGRGALDDALRVLHQVLARKPDDWRTHANLTILLAGRDPAAALQHAREAYRLEPRSVQTRANLASALADKGLTTEALEILRLLDRDLPADHSLRPQLKAMIQALER